MFVWLTYSQTLVAVIAGCEAAWGFFGGCFKVLVTDNLKPVVTNADAVNPQLSQGWLDYAQHAGFGTDPARVRSPQDKPRVERAVQYVRGNFWAGESFTDLVDAQARVEVWCRERAGMRIHGTTAQRPAEMFTELEAQCLLEVPQPYDVPVFTRVKVHRDYHVEVAKALYSIPEQWIGQHLDARADSELVKLYSSGKLVKTHPRQPPGGRSTDREDLPEDKAGYALRDLSRLIGACAGHGANIGIYAERLLDDPLPWTRMRCGLSAARAGPPLRPWTGRGRLRTVAGPRGRLGLEDRLDAGQGHRARAAGAARRGRLTAQLPRWPVRPRPQRVLRPGKRRQRPAHPHPRRRGRVSGAHQLNNLEDPR